MAPKNEQINHALMRTVAYVRCSHQEQKLHGYTVETQVKNLKKYAENHGMVISEWYIDEAKSSSKQQNRRTEFQRLLKDIEAGKVNFILFTRLDRWFRDIKHYYRVDDIISKHNVLWRCTEENFSNYGDGAELLHFKIVLAQMEADKIGQRVKDVFNSMVEDKKPITGSQIFGYKIGGKDRDKTIVKDEAVSDIIYDIYDHYEAHRSKKATTKYICEKYDRAVSYKTVTKVLTNRKFTGEYRGVDDYYPAYISKERFERIQEIIKSNVKTSRKSYVFVFSGLITCGHCGCRYVGSTTKGSAKTYKTYRCSKYNNYNSCPNKKSFSEIVVEKYLLENLGTEVEQYELKAKIAEAEKPKTKNTVAKIKGKIKRIQQMYRDEMMEYEDYKEEYTELKAKLEKAEAEEKKQPETRDLTPIKDLLESGFHEMYATLSESEKATFSGKILREIKVYDNGKIRLFF